MSPQADILLEGVALLFRAYRHGAPSLKQAMLNGLRRRRFHHHDDFWLYEGLSLHVPHGQRLGIVGPNGAGKSTLLKLIAGIYHPTRGRLRVQGTIAPLIELGAGMNHELSGRENILLNGAALGHAQARMKARTQAILNFAGLNEQADTPIKYYSTGMLMRLAFAIATDVEPQVLLIDEVFAGGDAEFVERARQRMDKLMDTSHIVVLVSHQMGLIRELCDRVVWIEGGRVVDDGDAAGVCDRYESRQHDRARAIREQLEAQPA